MDALFSTLERQFVGLYYYYFLLVILFSSLWIHIVFLIVNR